MLPAIKVKQKLRFGVAVLREYTGEKAFARGEAYFQAGHVDILSLRGAAEQAGYVAAVKQRFGRKRNFMKLLA